MLISLSKQSETASIKGHKLVLECFYKLLKGYDTFVLTLLLSGYKDTIIDYSFNLVRDCIIVCFIAYKVGRLDAILSLQSSIIVFNIGICYKSKRKWFQFVYTYVWV